MANLNGNGGWFSRSMSNGLMATVVWFVLLLVYVIFKILKIEDPVLTSAFQLLTGAWIGTLAAALGQKQETQKKATEEVQAKVEKLTEVAIAEHPEIAEELEPLLPPKKGDPDG